MRSESAKIEGWSAGALLGALLQVLPAMGEQIFAAAVGPAGVDALEEVGEVAARIDAGGVGGRDEREPFDYAVVRERVAPVRPTIPSLPVPREPDFAAYDALLTTQVAR